jgi:hypothetical protein
VVLLAVTHDAVADRGAPRESLLGDAALASLTFCLRTKYALKDVWIFFAQTRSVPRLPCGEDHCLQCRGFLGTYGLLDVLISGDIPLLTRRKER